ncbi:CBS domain protein [Umbribacter vaginalis]|nr:CBS domain protein [Coriobacteriales bacterium DNF00809]
MRDVSEDEIKSLVDDADNLIDDKKRMIGEILDLDELAVSDVMTPRVDMIGVSDDETVRSALERMLGTGYSRMPVFHEDLDSIVGLIHLKDLVQPALDGQELQLAVQYSHDTFFIPETKDLFSLLREMQEKRQQMAVVVDEYGGTDGLITVEDIVEEIVGEIIDESDSQHAFLIEQGNGEWIADGRLTVEDAREAGFPIEESQQYDTIAGWFMSVIDAVPQIGREIQHEGFCFRVQDMRRRRIRLLHISRMLSGNLSDSTSEHHTPEHQSLHNAERTVVHDAIHNASNNTSRKHADCLEPHTDNATSTQTSSIHASVQSSAPSLASDGVVRTSPSTVSADQSCISEVISECAHTTHHAAAQQAEQSDTSRLAKTPEKDTGPANVCPSRIDTP